MSPDAAPDRIGPYEITGELGRGGMGVVYRARRPELNRDYALKVITPSQQTNAETLARFQREAQAAAALSDHPGIVGVHDIGESDGYVWFAMDLVDGDALDRRIDAGDLDPADVARWIEQAARAIQHAHDRGVLHRDLKPGNILITGKGAARVADFGLVSSQATDSESARLTQSGVVLGTPAYMPPEQALGKGLDPRADVYALGATLYECLVGTTPFPGDSLYEILGQVIRDEPKPPSRRAGAVPRALEIITMKCLAKAPEDRYPSAGALADDLGRFLRDEPILARPPSAGQRAVRWAAQHKTLVTAAGLTAAAAVVVAGVVQWSMARAGKDQGTIESLKADVDAGARARKARESATALVTAARATLTEAELLRRVPGADYSRVQELLERGLAQTERACATDESFAVAQRLRGEALRKLGRHADAVAACDRAVELHDGPENRGARALALLEQYLALRGAPVPVLESRTLEAIDQPPETAVTRALRARIDGDLAAAPDAAPAIAATLQIVDRRYAEGLSALGAIAAQQPHNVQVRLVRAHALLLVADLEQAEAEFQGVLGVAPASLDARLGLGLAYLARFAGAEALQLCEDAPAALAQHPRLKLLRAQALLARGDLPEAHAAIADAAAAGPDDAEILMWWAVIPERVGGVVPANEAIDRLQRAVEANPLAWRAWSKLGVRLGMEKRWDEASAALDRAVELRPTGARALLSRARLRLVLGRFTDAVIDAAAYAIHAGRQIEFNQWRLPGRRTQQAIAELAPAHEAAPGDARIRFALAAYRLYAQENVAHQVAEFRALLDDAAVGAHAAMLLAQAGRMLGQPDLALEGARALTRRLGRPYGAARLVAAVLSRTPDRMHECTEWYEQMLQDDPWNSMAAFNCAARSIAARRWDDARELCIRSTAAYSNGQPHILLARMYALGLMDDAAWNRAQRRCRTPAALMSALAYARMRMHGLEEAADYRPDPAAWIDMHSWAARVRYLIRAGRAQEILPHQEAFLRTVERGPQQLSRAWTDLGMANFAAGNFDEAARCFERAGAAWGGPRNQQACAARAAAVRAWGAKQTRPTKVAEDSLQIAVILDYIGRYDEAAKLIEQTAIIISRQGPPAPLSFRRTMLRIRVSALLRGGRPKDALAALSAGLPDVSFGGNFVPLWTRAMAGAGEWEQFTGYLGKQAHLRMAPFDAAPPMIEAAVRGHAPHLAALILENFEVLCLTDPANEEFMPVGDVRALRRMVWDALPATGGTPAEAAARTVRLLMAHDYHAAEREAAAGLAALDALGPDEPAPTRVAAKQPGLRATLWWLTARARAGNGEPATNQQAWRVGVRPVRADDAVLQQVVDALEQALAHGWTTQALYFEAPELRRLRAFDRFDPLVARFKR